MVPTERLDFLTEKKCSKCGRLLSIGCFKKEEKKSYKRGWRYHSVCRECCQARGREYSRELKDTVIAQYGGCCMLCDERRHHCLEIHHRDGNNDGQTGKGLYLQIITENFPDKYQLLCRNCHADAHYTSDADNRPVKPPLSQ